ncbi:MAG: hypothetical protein P8N46_05935, partial [Flavobacteriales bacterium]|nr:hypothetical protein [Flavobacteriales bacterium]
MKCKLFFLLILSSTSLSAQLNLVRDNTLIIEENNIIFNSALAGGINAAQFSNLDLNLDGVMDILIF